MLSVKESFCLQHRSWTPAGTVRKMSHTLEDLIVSPQEICWSPTPPVPVNVTSFGNGVFAEVIRFWWDYAGSGWAESMRSVLIGRESVGNTHTHTERRGASDDRGRDCTYVTTMQETTRTAGRQQKLGQTHGRFPLRAFRTRRCWPLDLGPLAAGAVGEWISVVLCCPVCGSLLPKPQETNTRMRRTKFSSWVINYLIYLNARIRTRHFLILPFGVLSPMPVLPNFIFINPVRSLFRLFSQSLPSPIKI